MMHNDRVEGPGAASSRTETAMFQDHVWPKADAMLFLRGRVQFRLPGGGAQWPSWGAKRPDRLRAGQRLNAGHLRAGRGLCAAAGR